MKDLKDILLQRRSIRRYERRSIEPEKLELIYQAICNTPTSYNGQQFSVIAVSDQPTKELLYQITGEKQIKTCAIFLVFCLDYNKLRIAGEARGATIPDYVSTIDAYTVGVIDASLAMMSAIVVAEGLGLGCCPVGYIRTADPVQVSQILHLPTGTALVCGLTIGYPNEHPDLKPKLPKEVVVYTNQYGKTSDIAPHLLAYDAKIHEYNQRRAGTQTDNDWIKHILAYHEEAMNHSIADYLHTQLGLQCHDKK